MTFEEGAMLLSNSCKIWLYPEVVDFRKQLNGLIVLIVDVLKMRLIMAAIQEALRLLHVKTPDL